MPADVFSETLDRIQNFQEWPRKDLELLKYMNWAARQIDRVSEDVEAI
jgi:hypothetical protein